MSHYSLHLKRRIAVVLTAGLLVGTNALLTMPGAAAGGPPLPRAHVVSAADAAGPTGVFDATLAPDDEASGKVNRGLARGRSDGPCADLLEAPGRRGVICTHGPDKAPAGVDVRKERTVDEVASATKAASATAGTTSTGTVPCYGDGTSGNRVEAIYAVASDRTDRYASMASLFPQWAANADAVFAQSAAKTGGVRHLRWVTDAGCNLSVARVTLSPTGDDDYSATVRELQALGFDRSDRKYMVWVDANVYCGIGSIRGDIQPGPANMNNDGRSWARVDSGCWGYYDSPESHEIMHMMGGVMPTAPHGSAAWHCTDEYDRMCYSDGPGITMTYPCASAQELLFDCGNDDYYHTSPAPTSYLGTNWNAAMNVFLETVEPAGGSTTTTIAPPPTTSTTVPANPTTTSNWSGAMKGKAVSASHGFTSGTGTVVASATFSGGSATLAVKTSSGAVVGQKSGPSGVSVSVPVSAGSYTVTITTAKNASYAITVTRPSP
jgi:hypothetical protein